MAPTWAGPGLFVSKYIFFVNYPRMDEFGYYLHIMQYVENIMCIVISKKESDLFFEITSSKGN